MVGDLSWSVHLLVNLKKLVIEKDFLIKLEFDTPTMFS